MISSFGISGVDLELPEPDVDASIRALVLQPVHDRGRPANIPPPSHVRTDGPVPGVAGLCRISHADLNQWGDTVGASRQGVVNIDLG
jgi:hypothetical protein